ncbi:MAG: RnfH family protein [Burkholderiales bacterium]|nr:RnfH family protein [Burkholderiales bacterium]
MTIEVEVAFAAPDRAFLRRVVCPDGATVRTAIVASGLLAAHPEIDLRVNRVGIWGRLATLETPLGEADRVEVYRPLTADPKEARRRRAGTKQRA